ncbi:MAG: gliding motility protein GldN [Saprospiraceae bacterium]|nr:gliding motility protein GldN [Saprospiraceae bacterium]MBK7795245.1 gliding motility protein GldN [Saprospiraceae bacterium]MBK9378356.1 gliding motility protein GldN [Saprospiraceae bacterium]MBL0261866.1 gliding motility protein GldN [Saprospiraceae bacterium]
MLKKWFSILSLFCCLSLPAFSQMEEEMTEASNPEDTSGYLDDIVERKILQEQRFLAYEPIREADILWSKRIWRVIDVREKMNIGFMYPNRPFFKILLDGIQNGDIAIFDTDEFKKKVTGEDLDKMLHSVDTQSVWDAETYQEEVRIIKNDLDYTNIKTFRVKEIWYFDKESSRLNCRILGIAPIQEKKNAETGEVEYSLPMFWIYYPEARKYLTKEMVFNDRNDSAPGSWADLFDSRFFSSYIFKQSNVQDMRLPDLFTGEKYGEQAGVNMLLESEKIKNELLNFEHDLWVY